MLPLHMVDNAGNLSNHTPITDKMVIKGALSRVLNSPELSDSKRSKQFLNYVVKKHLDGDAKKINGTTIAQDVLGASDNFDPSTNPIVRVQAGRLRKLLSEYYRNSGKEDNVLITIAKGQYAPRFTERAAISSTVGSTPKQRYSIHSIAKWCGGAMVAAIVFAALFFGLKNIQSPSSQVKQADAIYPSIAILPFKNMTNNPKNDVFTQGFQHQLGTDLSRFRIVRIIFSGLTYEEVLALNDPIADYVLEGTFLSLEDEVDLLIKLIDVKSTKMVAQHRIKERSEGDSYFHALASISSYLSMQYAGRVGVLAEESLANLMHEKKISNITSINLKAFECLSLFHKFEANKTIENFNLAAPCLQHQVSQEGVNSSLYSALAWVTVYGAPETGLFKDIPNPENYSLEKALELAEKAVEIDPSNSVAHNYMSLIQWRLGRSEAAIMSIRRSIQLNPADASSLVNLGQFLCYSGDWENGLKALHEAIRLSPNAQYWYYTPLFAKAVLDRDGQQATLYAQKHVGTGGLDESTFVLIAASLNEDKEKIEKLKPLVKAYAQENEGDPLYMTRRALRSSMIIDALEAELIAVGIAMPET